MELLIVYPCMPFTIDFKLFGVCQKNATWVCMLTSNLVLSIAFQSQGLWKSFHIRVPWYIVHCQLWCSRPVERFSLLCQQYIGKWKTYSRSLKNIRSAISNAFNFYKIRLPNAEEIEISIHIFYIPPFHQSQTINSSLLFLSESLQGFLAIMQNIWAFLQPNFGGKIKTQLTLSSHSRN